ncbi:PDR/VanB family oxidoreductase [Rhodococcus sp. T2V]|uniref:PDR/VanB family oxidoreductase n=1 Tax=Rhodococcus sp. T2V TaxID=3034164 RepID=UPI0023E2D0A3|nr:PDR/VanB family oxidoreductase [Rhodococcus sp. T2V]MDF3311473.1 PDR/VanB family oxidoreductase [Rhodococcus sp. T2V]
MNASVGVVESTGAAGDITTVRVVNRELVAAGVVSLQLQSATAGALPSWEPGAHIDVLLPNDMVRQYSLCGDPEDSGSWRIAVLREQDGRGGSAYIHDHVTCGSELRVRGPRNNFTLEPRDRYLFIAGGIGITPLLPMMARAARRGAEFDLLYGGRSRPSMAFVHELGHYGDRVRLWPKDEFGHLDLDGAFADPRYDAVYCCGPEPLLAAVEQHGAARPDGFVHIERFRAATMDRPTATACEVVLDRSGTSYHVPADRSILEVLDEAGEDVAYSCTEGTCGTCETRVLAGEIEHRDSVLSPAERRNGDRMMICVSRCQSRRLVLDM